MPEAAGSEIALLAVSERAKSCLARAWGHTFFQECSGWSQPPHGVFISVGFPCGLGLVSRLCLYPGT